MIELEELLKELGVIRQCLEDEARKGDWPKESQHLVADLIARIEAEPEGVKGWMEDYIYDKGRRAAHHRVYLVDPQVSSLKPVTITRSEP